MMIVAAPRWTPGQLVYYVPRHAGGTLQHPDVEPGRVVRVTEAGVFVRFGADEAPKLCDPATLR